MSNQKYVLTHMRGLYDIRVHREFYFEAIKMEFYLSSDMRLAHIPPMVNWLGIVMLLRHSKCVDVFVQLFHFVEEFPHKMTQKL